MTPAISTIQTQIAGWLSRVTPAAGVRRVVALSAALASDMGVVRRQNEDRAVIARGTDRQGKGYIVAVVADGIGGMRNGAESASLTIGAFVASLYDQALHSPCSSEDRLLRAATYTNSAVFKAFQGRGGATLVAALLRQGYPTFWVSAGDSRVYFSDGANLTQVSVDDTIAGQLGIGDEAEREQSQLIQWIGMEGQLEPHIGAFDIESSGSVILTTDGVHNMISGPQVLSQIVKNAQDPGACVKRLVDLAMWCGGPDNATAVMSTLSAPQNSSDGRAPSTCLEIWDSFGELQIVTCGSAEQLEPAGLGKQSMAPAPTTSAESPRVACNPTAEGGERSAALGKQAAKRKARKVRGKGTDVTRKEEGDPSGSSESELPQLIIEFPIKNP